jgi:hypothetical protein
MWCIKIIKNWILKIKNKYKKYKKYDKIKIKSPSRNIISLKRFEIYDDITEDFESEEFNSSYSDSDIDLSDLSY